MSVDGFVFITKTPRRVSAHRNGFPCSARLPPWSGISIARIRLASCVTPSVQSVASRGRNLDLLSIDYAFRPRLRSRLTLGGLAFPRNPWAYGECVSHTLCATHADILTSLRSTEPRGSTSPPRERSPTDERQSRPSRGFGDMLSPLYFRRGNPRPVSCYALFKGWLLLSQPPGCPGISTSLPH